MKPEKYIEYEGQKFKYPLSSDSIKQIISTRKHKQQIPDRYKSLLIPFKIENSFIEQLKGTKIYNDFLELLPKYQPALYKNLVIALCEWDDIEKTYGTT